MLLSALTCTWSVSSAQPGRSLMEAKPFDSLDGLSMRSLAPLLLKANSYGSSAEKYLRRKMAAGKGLDTALLRREFCGMLDTNYPRVLAYSEIRSRMDATEIRAVIKFLQSAAGSKLRNLLSPTKMETEYWDNYLQKTYALALTKVKALSPRLAIGDSAARPATLDTSQKTLAAKPVRKDSLTLVSAKIVLKKPDSVKAIVSAKPASSKAESKPIAAPKSAPNAKVNPTAKVTPSSKLTVPSKSSVISKTSAKPKRAPKQKVAAKPKAAVKSKLWPKSKSKSR